MYLNSLIKLNDYLNGLVVGKQSSEVKLNTLSREQWYTNPLNGNSCVDYGGLLYEKMPTGVFQVYDDGGIFDPMEHRVCGDHYAASHFAMMASVLYLLTNEKKYLGRVLNSLNFCFKILNGYPRVPWDMHYDFNCYALAVVFMLLKQKLPNNIVDKFYLHLPKAKTNRHRVANWRGQRTIYYQVLKKYGFTVSLKKKIMALNDQIMFKQSIAKDGCFDDHPGKSRPIQYHAFSLSLATILEQITGRAFINEKEQSLAYLLNFVAPDGDFNYFGRGHKQSFGYAPALFVLEANKKSFSGIQTYLDKIWNYVCSFQNDDGSFPLIFNTSNDKNKIGWYDYHRHSVYTSFFGAWLALAALENSHCNMEIKSKKKPLKKFVSENIFTFRSDEYFICLSKGFSAYSSECAVSPHKLYVKGIGTIFSCPGGPATRKKGFGHINSFKYEPINYFAPLYKRVDGKWIGPACIESTLTIDNDQVSFELIYGAVCIKRKYYFNKTIFKINDTIKVLKTEEIDEIRIINFPINIKDKTIKITGSFITISSAFSDRKVIMETNSDIPLTELESYEWVDGPVVIAGVTSPAYENKQWNVSYSFKLR